MYCIQELDADLRVDGGKIGFMRVCYTALPGVITMQMSGVDVRIRPNALKTLGRAVRQALTDWTRDSPDDNLVPYGPYPPAYGPGVPIVLSPEYHDPGNCPYHQTRLQKGVVQNFFCSRCAIRYDGVGDLHVLQPRALPELPVVAPDCLVAVEPEKMLPAMRFPRTKHARAHSASTTTRAHTVGTHTSTVDSFTEEDSQGTSSRCKAHSRHSSSSHSRHRHTMSGPQTYQRHSLPTLYQGGSPQKFQSSPLVPHHSSSQGAPPHLECRQARLIPQNRYSRLDGNPDFFTFSPKGSTVVLSRPADRVSPSTGLRRPPLPPPSGLVTSPILLPAVTRPTFPQRLSPRPITRQAFPGS
eukprot:Protomagalhaensia_sp_Gyna_25__5437@NODE_70_length_5637_cov_174_525366_g52_i0_p3_GENE_NODE_70_length_5637_cov_174_525366_g52_i0NODE_70_length_5637_cov_174_525366_g52_i0_p3_ORF_typecomplete_len355_score30_95_NODE_70_length_5637_cov_174_525366_g52_i043185382